MKIIVNADDFGIDIDRDLGIFYGVLKGYISSVSVITTNKIGIIRKLLISIIRKKASIGIHINLTDNPLIKYKMEELCNKDYKLDRRKFIFWRNAIDGTIDLKKIKLEITSQINRFIDEYKMIPDHIDGHNHCNIFNKRIEKIFEEYADKYKIHLRIPYEELNRFDYNLLKENNFFKDYDALNKSKIDKNIIIENLDYFFKYDMHLNNYMCIENCSENKDIKYIGTLYGYFRKGEILNKQIKTFNKNDTIQIMTHPGFYWKILKHKTIFSNKDRYEELNSLKFLKKILNNEDVEYITYKEYKRIIK